MKNILQIFAWLMLINSSVLLSSDTSGSSDNTDLAELDLVEWNTGEYSEYSDTSINILIDGKPWKKIAVNGFLLAKSSDKLKKLIYPYKDNIFINFTNQQEVEIFFSILKCIYKKSISSLKNLSADKLAELLSMAIMFEIDSVIKTVMNELVKKPLTIKNAKVCLQYSSTEDEHLTKAQKIAADFLVKIFKDIRAVYTGKMENDTKKKEEFLNLPPLALIAWLKSPDLVVDSENSVFYLTMLWLLKEEQKEERFPYFPELIKHIDFSRMKKEYLLDVVKNCDKFIKQEHIPVLRREVNEALLLLLLTKQHYSLKAPSYKRNIIPDRDEVMIKCVFQDVKTWDKTGKYYSSPVLINGYEFYYFLQSQTANNNPNILAGFLRCSGLIIPKQHYLPIQYSVSIQTPGGEQNERKFSAMKVIFEEPEKAIGGKLTTGNETWEDIIGGRSPIVRNNTITIIVTIEFLKSDTGCLSMNPI